MAYRDDCHVLCIQSLLLGGGFGFLTGQHGLVIDNLVQVRHSFLPECVAVFDKLYVGYYCHSEWDRPHS